MLWFTVSRADQGSKMPASTKKDLHLARSVAELNSMAEQNIPKVTNCRLWVASPALVE